MRASLDDAPPDERRRALVPFAPIWRAFAAFTQSDVGKFAHFVERADPYDVRFTLPVVMCAYVFDSGFIDAFRLDFDREAFTATFGRAVTCEAVGFFRHHSPHFADGAAELCLLIAHLMVDGSVEKLKFLMMGAHGGCGMRAREDLDARLRAAEGAAAAAAAALAAGALAAAAASAAREAAAASAAAVAPPPRRAARRPGAEAPRPGPRRRRPRPRRPRAAAPAREDDALAGAAGARPATWADVVKRRAPPAPAAETPAPPGLLRLTRADPALGAFERLLKDRYAEVRPSSARHSRDAPRAQVINAKTPAPEIIFYII
ncbi:hypothetical protein JL722_7829 [Aureococcus anophagefferens]|nr:hypothetical protein JL722_7829 [Aureococcus anophagefferens]